jgi:4-amino-4-deoxy-L-arabinose transferase-like glycosyltransferase
MACSPYILAFSLLVLAFVLRMFGVGDAPPRTDDLYNYIAADSWVKHGTLAMADGFYTRTKYYTIATAWFMELFGSSLGVARILAAIGGAILVPLVALWVRKVSNPLAAWIAGLILCVSYTSITWSQVVRFYSWHAIAMFVAAAAVYKMTIEFRTLRLLQWAFWLSCTLVALGIGIHLQAITALMVVALAAWVGLYLLGTGQLNFVFSSPKLLAASVLVVLLAAALALTFGHPILLYMWEELRDTTAWSKVNQDNWLFYPDLLMHQLNWLFVLLPVAIIIAGRRYPTPTFFCTTVFAVCLGLHTIAGMKALRYVIYLFPFMFAIWGLALSVVVPAFVAFVRQTLPASPAVLRTGTIAGVFLALMAVSLVIVADFRMTAAAIARGIRTGDTFEPLEYGFGRDQVHWTPYLPLLRSLQRSGVFVVSDSNRAIYYLDDYDVLLSKTELSDIGTTEFMIDHRTGKPDISTGDSIRKVIGCYPKGAILVTEAQWRSAYVPPDAADVIERETQAVPLPKPLNMRAYRWNHGNSKNEAACQSVYKSVRVPIETVK